MIAVYVMSHPCFACLFSCTPNRKNKRLKTMMTHDIVLYHCSILFCTFWNVLTSMDYDLQIYQRQEGDQIFSTGLYCLAGAVEWQTTIVN